MDEMKDERRNNRNSERVKRLGEMGSGQERACVRGDKRIGKVTKGQQAAKEGEV